MITLIAAISKNNCIGRDNDLPWHIPEDLQHFKDQTKGKIVVMGRKTWESIPEKYRPLPKRTNVVISRNPDYVVPEGVFLFTDLEEAFDHFKDQEIMVAGGGQIYTMSIPHADVLDITHVDQEIEDGHAFFPEIDMSVWKEVERVDRDGYSFVRYESANVTNNTN